MPPCAPPSKGMAKMPHRAHKCCAWDPFATPPCTFPIEVFCSPLCHWGRRRGGETSGVCTHRRNLWRCTGAFLDETNQTPERLESERERFPFCACTVLIQHSRLSAENKHFRPQLPLCSSPCLTGDVTDAFGQQCCSAGWGRGKAGSPGFAAQLPEMNDFLFFSPVP